MTEALRKAVDLVESLPEEEQDAIAEMIEREIADRRWDELLATPESDRFLERLISEAQSDEERGLIQESSTRW